MTSIRWLPQIRRSRITLGNIIRFSKQIAWASLTKSGALRFIKRDRISSLCVILSLLVAEIILFMSFLLLFMFWHADCFNFYC
jgi:hypothetical protein